MNYEKIYNQLIEKRKSCILEKSIGNELHHIIPRSLNGNSAQCNLVYLTVREHYIAHLLLWKITLLKFGEDSDQHKKMQHAFRMMCIFNKKHSRRFKFNSRLYEKYKKKAYETTYTDEFRLKCSLAKRGEKNPNYHKFGKDNPNYGSKRTLEQRKRMSEKQKEIAKRLGPKTGKNSPLFGRIRLRNIETNKTINVNPDDVQKYLNTNKWIIGGHITSEETKQKISKANFGRKMTAQQCQNISNGLNKRYAGENGDKIRKAISDNNKQLVWITNIKTNKVIRIKNSDLDKYLSTNEWIKGRKNLNTANYIWLHNKQLNVRVRIHKDNINELQKLITSGYEYGTGNHNTGVQKGTKNIKNSLHRSGTRRLICPDGSKKYIKIEDIPHYIELGWKQSKRSKPIK